MTFFEDLKTLFTAPCAKQEAIRQLQKAKVELLEAQAAREHSTAIAGYHAAQATVLTGRIQRLTEYLAHGTSDT